MTMTTGSAIKSSAVGKTMFEVTAEEFEEFRSGAHAAALRVSKNPTEAEDISSRAVERWLKSMAAFKSNPFGAGYTSGYRLSIDALRSAETGRKALIKAARSGQDTDTTELTDVLGGLTGIGLTDLELQVAEMFAVGFSIKDVREELNLTQHRLGKIRKAIGEALRDSGFTVK